jgi:hypothetical protein
VDVKRFGNTVAITAAIIPQVKMTPGKTHQ